VEAANVEHKKAEAASVARKNDDKSVGTDA
jgi:hypothetical protein